MSEAGDKIRTVLVVGAGAMGHGIAQTCAAKASTRVPVFRSRSACLS